MIGIAIIVGIGIMLSVGKSGTKEQHPDRPEVNDAA
jgi:hypothetical protein